MFLEKLNFRVFFLLCYLWLKFSLTIGCKQRFQVFQRCSFISQLSSQQLYFRTGWITFTLQLNKVFKVSDVCRWVQWPAVRIIFKNKRSLVSVTQMCSYSKMVQHGWLLSYLTSIKILCWIYKLTQCIYMN